MFTWHAQCAKRVTVFRWSHKGSTEYIASSCKKQHHGWRRTVWFWTLEQVLWQDSISGASTCEEALMVHVWGVVAQKPLSAWQKNFLLGYAIVRNGSYFCVGNKLTQNSAPNGQKWGGSLLVHRSPAMSWACLETEWRTPAKWKLLQSGEYGLSSIRGYLHERTNCFAILASPF